MSLNRNVYQAVYPILFVFKSCNILQYTPAKVDLTSNLYLQRTVYDILYIIFTLVLQIVLLLLSITRDFHVTNNSVFDYGNQIFVVSVVCFIIAVTLFSSLLKNKFILFLNMIKEYDLRVCIKLLNNKF